MARLLDPRRGPNLRDSPSARGTSYLVELIVQAWERCSAFHRGVRTVGFRPVLRRKHVKTS